MNNPKPANPPCIKNTVQPSRIAASEVVHAPAQARCTTLPPVVEHFVQTPAQPIHTALLPPTSQIAQNHAQIRPIVPPPANQVVQAPAQPLPTAPPPVRQVIDLPSFARMAIDMQQPQQSEKDAPSSLSLSIPTPRTDQSHTVAPDANTAQVTGRTSAKGHMTPSAMVDNSPLVLEGQQGPDAGATASLPAGT